LKITSETLFFLTVSIYFTTYTTHIHVHTNNKWIRYVGVSVLDISVRTLVYIDVSGPDIFVLDVSARKANVSVLDISVRK